MEGICDHPVTMNISHELNSASLASEPPGFDHVDTWVFDLDKTLYLPGLGLFTQIEMRMCSFIAVKFNLDPQEAWEMQKRCYKTHGTTLKGLMKFNELTRRGLTPDDFLTYAHDIDYSILERDERLKRAIAALPGRRVIFTNGTKEHAERVLNSIGIEDLFDGIFDIRASRYVSKPEPEAFTMMAEALNVDPKRSAFFEDSYQNLPPAAGIGMVTVWVRDETNTTPMSIVNPGMCHYVTDDLAPFLETIVEKMT